MKTRNNNRKQWFVAAIVASSLIAAGAARATIIQMQAGNFGQPATVIEDAMLAQGSVNGNYGGRTDFEVGIRGNSQVRDAVMRFDVTDPTVGLFSGSTPLFTSINSITLTLTTTTQNIYSPATSDTMDLRVAAISDTQGDWVEGTQAGGATQTGSVSYNSRVHGTSTWSPNSNYHRGTGDGELGSYTDFPGYSTSFTITLSPVSGETLTDLIMRWATGNNEGVMLNGFNFTQSGTINTAWFIYSSEAGTISDRPLLTIDYNPVIPEPSVVLLLGVGGLMLFRRRQGFGRQGRRSRKME